MWWVQLTVDWLVVTLIIPQNGVPCLVNSAGYNSAVVAGIGKLPSLYFDGK